MRYAEKSYFILTPRRRDFALDFRTSDFAEGTFVNFVFLRHDSAIQVNLMALAAPSVRK